MRTNPRLASFRSSVPSEYVSRRSWRPSPRLAAVAALTGLLVGLALTPFMATIWICSPTCGAWNDEPLVVRTLGRWITERGWLSGPSGDALYFGFGRWFFLVYVGILAAVMSFRGGQSRGAGKRVAPGAIPYWVLAGSLGIALFGDVMSYGVGAFWTIAWSAGFGVEVLSWLGVIVGSVWFGVSILRHRSAPAWVGWAIVLGGVMIPVGFFDRAVVQYMPNAQILPLAAIWAAIAVWRARADAQAPAAISPAADPS